MSNKRTTAFVLVVNSGMMYASCFDGKVNMIEAGIMLCMLFFGWLEITSLPCEDCEEKEEEYPGFPETEKDNREP